MVMWKEKVIRSLWVTQKEHLMLRVNWWAQCHIHLDNIRHCKSHLYIHISIKMQEGEVKDELERGKYHVQII